MHELINTLVEEFEDAEYAHAYLEENSNLRIAAQVRALRIAKNWSQQDLAERASMRQERISKIEMGDFDSLTLKTLRRLAAAFDVHLSVEFSSVEDAIRDIVTLSAESLACDDRPRALARLREQASRTYISPQGATTSATIALSSGNLSTSSSSSARILVRA
ncbi:TPA: helix-turn-helix transcriptional regulator [Burkholderia vietnamiensis]|nr:helix-turn-helix transcriptional regulator [Burkholderia vietnamiensis]HDR9212269.1 helix-turn-helix transcriptional regulator [Burkholderia vietnamiensis]